MKNILALVLCFVSLSSFANADPVETFKPENNTWFKITNQKGEIKNCFSDDSAMNRDYVRIKCVNLPKGKETGVDSKDWPKDGQPRNYEQVTP